MKLVTTVFAAVATLTASTVLAAGIGVVNMESIFKNSPQTKAINAKLQAGFKKRQDALKARGQQIQADMVKYNKNKSVMKPAAAKALAMKIGKEEQAFRKAQMQYQSQMMAAQSSEMKKFMGQVDGVISKVAKANKLDVILPKTAVVWTSRKDITADVMKSMK